MVQEDFAQSRDTSGTAAVDATAAVAAVAAVLGSDVEVEPAFAPELASELSGITASTLLQALIRTSGAGLAFLDAQLRYRLVSERLAEMNGIPAADHLGRDVEAIRPNIADHARGLITRMIASDEPLLRLDVPGSTLEQPGVRRVWEASWFPVRRPDGDVFGAWVVVIDVTDARVGDERALLLHELTAALVSATGVEETTSRALDAAVTMLGGHAGAVGVLDLPDPDVLRLAGMRGYERADAERWRRLPLDSGYPITEAVRTNRPVLIGDRTTLRDALPAAVAEAERYGDHAWVALPLRAHGRVLGVLAVNYRNERWFTDADRMFLETVASIIATALDQALSNERSRRAGEELNRAFIEIADAAVTDDDVTEALRTLCRRALDISDADVAAVQLRDSEGVLRLRASAGDLRVGAAVLDECDDCPAVAVIADGTSVVIADTAAEAVCNERPDFAQRAVRSCVGSGLTVPLRLDDSVIGALTLLRGRTDGDDEHAVVLAQALADLATLALLHERLIAADKHAAQLQYALESRVVIEQAKGMLAEQAGLGVDAAFNLLRDHARTNSRRLHPLAADVTERDIDAQDMLNARERRRRSDESGPR